jgi:conjugal transfer pilus assembly protein TraV
MIRPFLSPRGLSALAICISVSACANISGLGGSAEYGCKAPKGVRCDSVSGNYYNAIQNNLPTQRQHRQANATDSVIASHPQPAAAATGNVPSSTATAPVTLTVSPLRSQARVLRLWFKPWEDADHDLYDQGFVFVQIDNGRWLIDHAQQRIRDAYAPIRPPHSAALSPPVPTSPADPPLSGTSLSATPSKPLPGATDPADDSQ